MEQVIIDSHYVGPNWRKDPPGYLVLENGCWIYQGSVDKQGYPSGIARKMYKKKFGEFSIPPKYHLDHLCRTPSCVNPDHLEPVTCKENQHRKLRANGYKEY